MENHSVKEDRKQASEETYSRVVEEIHSVIKSFPDMELFLQEGLQAIASGISQGWRQKNTPGIVIHNDPEGLIVEVLVVLKDQRAPAERGRELQKQIHDRLYAKLFEPIKAVNLDILKVMR